MEALIIIILSGYFIIVLYGHFDTDNAITNHMDSFGLVPKWNFFAPTPGIHNFYLLYRYQHANGIVGKWNSLYDLEAYRKPTCFLWNPKRRIRKALFDLFATLILEDPSTEENRKLIRLSIPYLIILKKVSSLSAPVSAMGVQFLIMENFFEGPSKSVFTSDVHPLT